jgi:hypothetical protein
MPPIIMEQLRKTSVAAASAIATFRQERFFPFLAVESPYYDWNPFERT